ncbi:MAG: Sjogren's syndrome/scleroderma autoantigen 1 family protein [Candidatus Njordarchaeia archaeon]
MSDEETIRHIRELLLRGERLLDEHCPKCGTPLILIKETGLKYCPKCRVYIATEEELKRAKIDAKKIKVYDFDDYWKKKENAKREIVRDEAKSLAIEEEKDTVRETPKSREEVEIIELNEEETLSRLDVLITLIVDKMREKIEKQDLTLEQMINLLDKIIQLRQNLENKERKHKN